MWKIMKDNVEDLLSPNLWRSLACETLGTLVIVLLGCGAWVPWSAPDVVQISLAFGLAVGTTVWIFTHISGGHFNPSVTAAALVTRRVSIIRGVLYIVAQIIGGILGAGALYGLTPATRRGDLGATIISSDLTAAQAFGVELLITFLFVLAVFASRDSARTDLGGSSPLTIGLAVVVCHLFAVSSAHRHDGCACGWLFICIVLRFHCLMSSPMLTPPPSSKCYIWRNLLFPFNKSSSSSLNVVSRVIFNF